MTIVNYVIVVNYTKLMVVGGREAEYTVQVVNLSGDGKTCTNPVNYPYQFGATGAYFNGHPFVCGGATYSGGSTTVTNQCYKYNKQVRIQFGSSTGSCYLNGWRIF